MTDQSLDTTGAAPTASKKEDGGLVAAGWITALFLPIVGFFVGLALLIRGNRIGHGIAVMITSVLLPVIIFSVILASASSELDSYGECIDQAQTVREMNTCE